jgi:hypothetical protein
MAVARRVMLTGAGPAPRAALLAAALAVGCASALRRPPAVSDVAGAPASPSGRSAADLLAEARAHFARRPDPAEVRRAEALFLDGAAAEPAGTDGLYGAIQAKVWLLEHAPPPDPAALATSAVDAGQLCLARAPERAACHYGLALALGLQARERHATALDGLKRMAEHLQRAAAEEPTLDQGGPDRVLAVMLVRAPGWPTGPGDPETGLARARAAAQRFPAYPPNQLTLAEALLATGSAAEGHAAAEEALRLARDLARAGDPDAADWIRSGERLRSARARAAGGS